MRKTDMAMGLLAAGLLAGAAGAASAQIQTLPETSRSQGQANSINENLASQGQNRGVVQQNQFEINSLRTTPGMGAPPAPGVSGPGVVGPAPVRR